MVLDRSRSSSSGPSGPEQELALLLAGTRAIRDANTARILALLERVSTPRLEEVLARQALLPLLGTRLIEIAGDRVPEEFQRQVEGTCRQTRDRMLAIEALTLRLVQLLGEHGIPAMPLKGPFLARALHGDPGLRASGDIDLLVDPGDFARALEVIGGLGWVVGAANRWDGDLPLFETTMRSHPGGLPAIDLHWRLHWYERPFAGDVVKRSELQPDGSRRLAPADELASLLLFFARDGFWGLRMPADIGAWWDTRGHLLDKDGLEPLIERYPELGDALRVSARVAERLVGLPAAAILDPTRSLGRRARRAGHLAYWTAGLPPARGKAVTVLVDLLLSPRKGFKTAVTRHFFPPPTAIDRLDTLPENARVRRSVGRVHYAVVVAGRNLPIHAEALWGTRGGRDAAPIPPTPA